MTEDLRSACAALVALKDMDAPSTLPDDWLYWALPFCPLIQYNFKAAVAEFVHAEHIVSCTRRSLLEHSIEPSRAAELMDGSDGFVTNEQRFHDQAPHQVRIGTLPLYCAREGKNRVALFKSTGRMMHAFVTPLDFPPAETIKLVRTWPYRTWQAVCEGRILDVPCQQSLNLLLVYGVRIQSGYRFDLLARRRVIRERRAMLAREKAFER